MATHTPTPWRWERDVYRPQDGVIVGANGQTVCRLSRTLQDGNAAYMLHAANSYEEALRRSKRDQKLLKALMTALRAMLKTADYGPEHPDYPDRLDAEDTARTAVKLAEEV